MMETQMEKYLFRFALTNYLSKYRPDIEHIFNFSFGSEREESKESVFEVPTYNRNAFKRKLFLPHS